MNRNNKGKGMFSSKRFKYGSVALAFTVIFTAFVILLNGVFSAIAGMSGGFYLDLTGERIYNISDKTVEVLAGLDKNVEIIFCMTEDRVEDRNELAYIKRLAEKYHSANNRVSVLFRDCVKDPVYFNQFKKTETDTISQYSVIVNCPENKRYIVYPAARFFKFSSESGKVFAYDGENKLTSAVMQTAVNQIQKAAFVTGHGEEKRSSVETLLREQGYEVSEVDLKSTTEEALSTYDVLIISNPKYDYTGISAAKEGRVNEIGMLTNYLTKSFGNLMVFVGPETPILPEFSNFLSDDWGVVYTSGDIVAESSARALDSYGMYFVGTPNNTNSYGKDVHTSITSSGVQATVFANAMPLALTFTEKADKNASVIYYTSESSARIHDGKASSAPSLPVMTLSVYSKIYDNSERRANVLVCGSVDYMNYVSEQSFANADILKSCFSIMGNESIVTGIGYKVLEDTVLTVTRESFKNYAVMLSTVVPLLIAVLGIVIYIKRKKA